MQRGFGLGNHIRYNLGNPIRIQRQEEESSPHSFARIKHRNQGTKKSQIVAQMQESYLPSQDFGWLATIGTVSRRYDDSHVLPVPQKKKKEKPNKRRVRYTDTT